MITIPEVVEKIVKNSYFLEEGLTTGIINLSSLARKLKPEIEKEVFKKTSEGAIVMALKRLSTKFKPMVGAVSIFKHNPEIILRSNLIEFSITNSQLLIEKHKRLFDLIRGSNNYFLTITQGIFETGIIISQDCKNLVEKIFKEEKIVKIFDNLSAITIKLPEENVMVPGIYYFILKALAWEKINVIEVVSTYCEFTMILEDKDIDRAFSCLKKLLLKWSTPQT